MNISIHIKRKFKINGKEYNSLEEMPDDIREKFKQTMASQADSKHPINLTTTRAKITFNGAEYGSMDAMPQDARQLYEKVLKATFGKRICFHGAVENQRILPFGTPDEVRAEVRHCIDSLASDGTSYILAPCHNLQVNTPVENIIAMYDEAWRYGKMP
ncbi:MAG: uroporphyrinogen decarboxylase family protein [Kiritimatiellae bacterium]|nr:uroporphyrinogen decarboxylase family protein [Kiritimatiellia bacterium]